MHSMHSSQDSSSPSEDTMLVSFGNPLLDMTAVVQDTQLHTQFKLPRDGQLEVEPWQRELFSLVLKKYTVQYSAGGCSLNSSRVFSWMLGNSTKAIFVGGIGEDEAAQQLLDIIHSSGVETRLLTVPQEPTGQCVALVLGAERCLCADIGAANICPPEHVFSKDRITDENSSSVIREMQKAQLLYVEGYFITHSFDTALKIAQFAREHNKVFVFNLCGSYVCENHPEELCQLLPYVDILFGFVEEYKTLEKHVNLLKLAEDHKNDIDPSLLFNLPKILNMVHKPNAETKSEDGTQDHLSKAKLKSPQKRTATGSATVEDSSSKSHSDSAQNGMLDGATTQTEMCPRIEECVISESPEHNCKSNGSTPVDEDSDNSHYFDNSEVLCDEYDLKSRKKSLPSSHNTQRLSPHACSSEHSSSTVNNALDNQLNAQGNSSSASSLLPNETSGNSNGCCSQLGKVIILTQGPHPLLYVTGNGAVQEQLVEPLEPSEIVDTTGAGDSFVGGFLAAMCKNKNLDDCILGGITAARHILRQKGCTLPSYPANYL